MVNDFKVILYCGAFLRTQWNKYYFIFVIVIVLTGVGAGDGKSIDAMNPTTEEEFEEFGKLLKDKLSKLESSDYYPSLLEDVFQSCCVCRK